MSHRSYSEMKMVLSVALLRHLLVVFLVIVLASCDRKAQPAYEDVTHTSAVFNKPKTYRLYLPAGYDKKTDRYPVIYFFHGWGGRYYKDDNAKLEYEKIKDLVDKYQVIMVMWDGSIVDEEPRPYNIGDHYNIISSVQMKDYFIELVVHVDSTYRTLAEKSHQGIIGFSMGGFMSYFLAGKYPDKVGAAVNMTGSPEFFVGDREVHTLYPVRYAFRNLRDVKIRFHNSTADELTFLNTEVHKGALWEGGLNYDYWQFVGGHVVDEPGKTAVFERAMKFVADAFKNPSPRPLRWSHVDLYPEFDVWDYRVTSDKNEPGFIFLKGVKPSGFGVSTLKWLPDGPPLNKVSVKVTTAPVYEPRTMYHVVTYPTNGNRVMTGTYRTDAEGRLNFECDQKGAEIGIFKTGGPADLRCIDYVIETNRHYLRTTGENRISLKLLNAGDESGKAQRITVVLASPDSSIRFTKNTLTMDWKGGERTMMTPPFGVVCNKKAPSGGEPSSIKFNVAIRLDTIEFEDEVEVPVFFDVPAFPSLTIDDGRPGKDSTRAYGRGNADGVASPGEEIMVYVDGHRTRLHTDDPFIMRNKETLIDEVLPSKWPDGFTLSSVVKIDSRCPDGHRIEFLANYETKAFMPIDRKLTWGKIWVTVKK